MGYPRFLLLFSFAVLAALLFSGCFYGTGGGQQPGTITVTRYVCADGSIVSESAKCAGRNATGSGAGNGTATITKYVCADGEVVGDKAQCPASRQYLCRGGAVVADQSLCPKSNYTCSDGKSVDDLQKCPQGGTLSLAACGSDMGCASEKLRNCEPASSDISGVVYEVRGRKGADCILYMKVNSLQPEYGDAAWMIGKDALCELNSAELGFEKMRLAFIISNSTRCQGPLVSEYAKSKKGLELATAFLNRPLGALSLEVAFTELEQQAFEQVNDERGKVGLKRLVWAEDVAIVARAHSRDMAKRDYFSHINPEGLEPFGRLDNAGIHYETAAENLGEVLNYEDPVHQTVLGWMNSPGHKKNIMNGDFEEAGMGVAQGSDGTYFFTQNFIKRAYCGYMGGECCTGNACYEPYTCENGKCT